VRTEQRLSSKRRTRILKPVTLVGACLVKSLYAINTWTRTAYFPGSSSTLWNRRATLFAKSASISGTSASSLSGVIDKIETFGIFYLMQRYVAAGKLSSTQVQAACQHVRGAATEVGITFATALARTAGSGSLAIARHVLGRVGAEARQPVSHDGGVAV
jgi:hypothetical protein